MEDYYYLLQKYLPLYFHSSENEEYLDYLRKAYFSNIKSETFQFAYIAFHLLYMSFIYKTLWIMNKVNKSDDLVKSFLESKNIADIYSPFDFSIGSETKSISLLQPLRFTQNQIEKFKIPISNRNHCAHASGRIEYKEPAVDRLIQNEIECVEEIFEKTNEFYLEIFNDFLDNNWNPDNREIALGADSLTDFMKNYQFSKMDIEYIINRDFPDLERKSNDKKTVYKKILILIFITESQDFIDLEEDYIQQKLEQLFVGYSKRTKIDLSTIINEEFYREKDANVVDFLMKRLQTI